MIGATRGQPGTTVTLTWWDILSFSQSRVHQKMIDQGLRPRGSPRGRREGRRNRRVAYRDRPSAGNLTLPNSVPRR
jgi:hypothetical protein